MRLIDADALYEKTAEWEARALAVVEKLNSKPFGEMDVDEITEWRKWSCVLNERSAFKHDVADAPTVEPQQWIPVTERLPEVNGDYLVTGRQGAVNKRRYDDGHWYGNWAVVAWMPLPAPMKGGEP